MHASHPQKRDGASDDESDLWLVTGAAGFIGSHLVEALLLSGKRVVGLDNFATGYQHNIDNVSERVGGSNWKRFRFIEADIENELACRDAVRGVTRVLHQAAIGSVPRSMADPARSHRSNVLGFFNMLLAARDAGVRSFVYAASSAAYGDDPNLCKQEDRIGSCLSPYATTKRINELYAEVFHRCYAMPTIGLRYFNVFGRRQDPNGAYAAVIPRWIAGMIAGRDIEINGDGETSRDFCHVDNVVKANLLAAVAPRETQGQVYNVAVSASTSLNELFAMILRHLRNNGLIYGRAPIYKAFRPGDVRHSLADITKAQTFLGYSPLLTLDEGIAEVVRWHLDKVASDVSLNHETNLTNLPATVSV